LRGVAEANWSMRFLVSLGTSSAISEVGMRLPRFARNDRGELLNNLTLIVDKDGIINRHLIFKVRVLS
jgi:hypothetical protein